MSNKVKASDIFEGDVFAIASKGAEGYAQSLIVASEVTRKFISLNKDLAAAVIEIKGSKEIGELEKAIKAGTAAQVADIKVRQEAEKLKQQEAKAQEADIKARTESEKLRQQEIKTSEQKRKADEAGTKVTGAQSREQKNLSILEDKEAGTLAKLRAENSLLTKERDKLNLSTKEGNDRLKEINAVLDKNNLFIKHNSDALTKQRLNVGNYTESIKNALKESGLFGESIERITSISEKAAVFYELLHGAIHTVTNALGLHTKATEESIAATEANTLATAENTTVAEASKIATEAQTVAFEAEAVATTEAEIATGRLTKALNFLKANPVLAVVAAVAAIATALYETATASQAGKDKFNELTEATEAFGKSLLLNAVSLGKYGGNMFAAAAGAAALARAEHELRDEQIANINRFAVLEKKAAQARLNAEEENKTTQEKIELLTESLSVQNELFDAKQEEAQNELKRAKEVVGLAKSQGTVTAEQLKAEQEAIAKISQLDTERFTNERRVTRRRTTLLEQDRKERLALLQASQKEEIDAVRITATERIDVIKQTRDKELLAENNSFEVSKKTLLDQQEKLGTATAEEKAQFQREEDAKLKVHLTNIFNINKKANEELLKEEQKIDEAREKEKQRAIKAELDLLEQKLKLIKEEFDETKRNASATVSADLEIMASKARVAGIVAKTEGEKAQAAIDSENAAFQAKLEGFKNIGITTQKENELIEQAKKEHEAILTNLTIEGEKKRYDKALEYAQTLTRAVSEEVDAQNQIKNEALNKEISDREKNIERQQELASKGLANQLAFEQAAKAREELARKEELERQRKQAEAIKLSELLMSNITQKLNSNKPFTTALTEGFAETLVVKALAKTIAGAFADGVENFKGKGTGTSDSNLIAFSSGESVVTAKATANNPGLVTALNNGTFETEYLPKYAMETGITSNMGSNLANSMLLQIYKSNQEALPYLKKIADKPVSGYGVDEVGRMFSELYSKGMKTKVTYVPKERI